MESIPNDRWRVTILVICPSCGKQEIPVSAVDVGADGESLEMLSCVNCSFMGFVSLEGFQAR